MKAFSIIYLILVLVCHVQAQGYPALEYQFIPSVSDEFENSSTPNWSRQDQRFNQYRKDGGVKNHFDTNFVVSGTNASIFNSSKVAKIYSQYSQTAIPTFDANGQTWINDVHYKMGVLCHKEDFRYGYYETRVKIPSNNVKVCSAFWLWNQNATNYNEIDVFENTPIDPYNWMMALHYSDSLPDIYKYNHFKYPDDPSCNSLEMKYLTPYDFSNAFQTFGMEWQPEYIKFYLNGKLSLTYFNLVDTSGAIFKPISVMNLPQYLIFFTKGDPGCGLYQPNLDAFEVDYFRYYKQKPILSDIQTLSYNTIKLTAHTSSPDDVFTWQALSSGTSIVNATGKSANIQLPSTGDAVVEVKATGLYPSASSISTYTIKNNVSNLCGSTISNGLYNSVNTITTPVSPCNSYIIPSGYHVTFNAPNSIYLNPGFEVKAGASFYAKTQ